MHHQIKKFKKKTKYSSKKIAIQHHMGLGDHLHLSGLVRYAISDIGFEEVVVFCKSRYSETINRLFSDNDKIDVVSLDLPNPSGPHETSYVKRYLDNLFDSWVYLRLGFEDYPRSLTSKVGSPSYIFYDMAEVPRSVRWSHFKFIRNEKEQVRVYKKLNPHNKPYIFVHDDPARGFNIPRPEVGDKLVIRNDISENILDFAMILENADEIYCMGSSIFCFADLLNLENTKCYFYDVRRPSVFPTTNSLDEDTKNNWIKIKS
jgi:hypothetical protein